MERFVRVIAVSLLFTSSGCVDAFYPQERTVTLRISNADGALTDTMVNLAPVRCNEDPARRFPEEDVHDCIDRYEAENPESSNVTDDSGEVSLEFDYIVICGGPPVLSQIACEIREGLATDAGSILLRVNNALEPSLVTVDRLAADTRWNTGDVEVEVLSVSDSRDGD